MKRNSIIVTILLFVILTSCFHKGDKHIGEKVYDVNISMEKNEFVNIENTRKDYNAHSGNSFSSIDSITQYGAGYVKKIDDSLKGYDVDIYLSAFIRELESPLEGGIAVSIFTPDGVKDWRVTAPKKNGFKPNEWCQIIDTIKYNHKLLENLNTEIKIFSVKPKGKDFLDVDDIKIKYVFHK